MLGEVADLTGLSRITVEWFSVTLKPKIADPQPTQLILVDARIPKAAVKKAQI